VCVWATGPLWLSGCHSEPRADLVIINGNEPESLDPAIVTAVPDMRVTKALFEGLLRLDGRTGRPVPGWAERWEVSPDGYTYTFHLRPNATWSTGEPITSADVLYSWMRAIDPATASDYAGQLFYIKNAEEFYNGKITSPAEVGLRAPDPHTFRVELTSPLAFFPDLCCFPTLAIVPRQSIIQHGDRWVTTLPLPSSGPYELVAWRLNDKIRLRKNPRYWGAAATQSDVVDLLPIGSPNCALNLYETRVADLIWDRDLVPFELMDLLARRPDHLSFDYLGTLFYRFNVTRKPMDDPRVRRAFALATDRRRIVAKLTSGGEKPADHFVPNGVANYRSPEGLSFDPDEARRLLADAGFPAGKGFPSLEYTYYSSAGGAGQMQAKIAVELKEMWHQVLGVEVGLRQIERKIFYNTQSRLDFDLCASSWVGDYNDANTFLDMYLSESGNNRTGWKNPKYDELIRNANRQTSPTQRAELLRQAESMLISEDVPIVPLYFYAGFILFRKEEIDGIYPNVLDEHPVQDIRKILSPSQSSAPNMASVATELPLPLAGLSPWSLPLRVKRHLSEDVRPSTLDLQPVTPAPRPHVLR
jgi:oligopeptide transport system substrate-binding protein